MRGETHKSVVLQLLALLEIIEDESSLRQANDFFCMLTGRVYCTRVLSIEILSHHANVKNRARPTPGAFAVIPDDYRRRFV